MAQILTLLQVRGSPQFAWHPQGYLWVDGELFRAVRLEPPATGGYQGVLTVRRSTLRDGDQLKIGRSILKFMSGNNVETSYHEEIFRLMTVDALTQTFNKRHFNDALEREFHRSLRYERALSLVLFDVDHFKKVNDTHGHLAGDRVLQKLCAAIKPRLRQQDLLARVGGEEFAILLPEVPLDGARITAEKARRIAEETKVVHGDVTISLTISLGAAVLDGAAMKAPLALYELADTNLYAAKQSGRNRVC